MKTFKIVRKTLDFNFKAGTSRGIYTKRDVWYIIIKDRSNSTIGIGESAPIPNLSCDFINNYNEVIKDAVARFIDSGYIDYDSLKSYPSILMGLETAEMQLKRESFAFFDNDFTRGNSPIQINGLVWMGDYKTMYRRLKEKIDGGFRCIKIKIGAINFDEEVRLIKAIRKDFNRSDLEIRLDANCAFSSTDAIEKLKILSSYEIHSIEQPIKVRHWDDMYMLTSFSPIDIALDEELIGVNTIKDKELMLRTINPKYIVIKPTLHGGIKGTDEWIQIAKKYDIGFWITSALESNIGLNAVSQIASLYPSGMAQGLGTGGLFCSNASSPLNLVSDNMYFDNTFSYSDNIENILKWIKN